MTRTQPVAPAARRPNLAAQQVRDPVVDASDAAADEQEQREEEHRDEGREDDEGDVVLRHPHEAPDLVLPVLAETEEDDEQHAAGDEQDAPGRGLGLSRLPVREGAPQPCAQDSEPVADGCGDPTDQTLDEAATREQRRGERQGREEDRAPAPRDGEVEQPPEASGAPLQPVRLVDRPVVAGGQRIVASHVSCHLSSFRSAGRGALTWNVPTRGGREPRETPYARPDPSPRDQRRTSGCDSSRSRGSVRLSGWMPRLSR